MHASTKYGDRTTVPVVSGVCDELVIEGKARKRREGIAVVCLDYALEPGIGQLVVADKDSQASGVEKLLVDAGDAVDRGGNAESVMGPPPWLAEERNPSGYGAVNVSKIPRLHAAVGPAGTGEHANVLGNLLLQVDAHARPAPVDAHRVDIGGLSGDLGDRNRIREFARPPTAEKARNLELAGLSPQLVPFLDFPDQLELMEAGVEINTVGAVPAGRGFRQIEEAAAQRPAALVPLRGCAIGVSPAIGGVVERAGIDV